MNWIRSKGFKNNLPKVLEGIKRDIQEINNSNPSDKNLQKILNSQKQKLKTVARICAEAIEKNELKKQLLHKLIERKMYNYKLVRKIEEKRLKKKMVDEKHMNEMHIENMFSKQIIQDLIQ